MRGFSTARGSTALPHVSSRLGQDLARNPNLLFLPNLLGEEQVQAVFYTSRRLPVVSPQKRTYRNLNPGCSKCQGILKEVTGYFVSAFLKCAAYVCLKKIRESLTLKVCIVSCEFPEYFLRFTLIYVVVTF